jgi:hypothetical protein
MVLIFLPNNHWSCFSRSHWYFAVLDKFVDNVLNDTVSNTGDTNGPKNFRQEAKDQ